MKDNEIEINSELYERLAIWSKGCGQDDVNEFIINLLLSADEDQKKEKKRKEKGKGMKNDKK